MPSRPVVSVLGGLSNHAWPKSEVPIVGSPDRSDKARFQCFFSGLESRDAILVDSLPGEVAVVCGASTEMSA